MEKYSRSVNDEVPHNVWTKFQLVKYKHQLCFENNGEIFLEKTECGIFVESRSLTTIIIGDAQIRSFISV